ncbi:unnamed protein product, partial [Discosporangium mesarthrocarpum]
EKPLPKLANTGMFWRASVLGVILGATNPGTVGRNLWESSPTLRCLMQV